MTDDKLLLSQYGIKDGSTLAIIGKPGAKEQIMNVERELGAARQAGGAGGEKKKGAGEQLQTQPKLVESIRAKVKATREALGGQVEEFEEAVSQVLLCVTFVVRKEGASFHASFRAHPPLPSLPFPPFLSLLLPPSFLSLLPAYLSTPLIYHFPRPPTDPSPHLPPQPTRPFKSNMLRSENSSSSSSFGSMECSARRRGRRQGGRGRRELGMCR